jgi:hypothetical protein
MQQTQRMQTIREQPWTLKRHKSALSGTAWPASPFSHSSSGSMAVGPKLASVSAIPSYALPNQPLPPSLPPPSSSASTPSPPVAPASRLRPKRGRQFRGMACALHPSGIRRLKDTGRLWYLNDLGQTISIPLPSLLRLVVLTSRNGRFNQAVKLSQHSHQRMCKSSNLVD